MESIINYFENMPSLHRSILLFGGLAFFMLLESGIPYFFTKYNKTKHTIRNIFFTLTTALVNLGLAFILLAATDYVQKNDFGVLNWLPEMPLWLYCIVGLMLLDLIGAYLIHFIQHKVKVLWKFHLIHHSDLHLDVTSANRHHPGESVFRFVFTTIGILIAGAPAWLVIMYQSLSALFSQFNHANIRLPHALDKVLSYIIVTPEMHRSHHHYQQPYTDTNYGNLFSIWDRLFGTYKYLENEKIVFGVDTHMAKEENEDIWNLLKIPFQPYRAPKGPIDG